MTKAKGEMVVGLVFMSGLLGLLYYTIAISGFHLGATKEYLVDFPEVYGLKAGDAVRVEGHEKGQVKSLELIDQGKGIRALLVVSDDVQIFKDGGSVTVTPFSPLGGRVVEIKRGREGDRGEYEPFTEQEGYLPIDGEAEGELLQTLNALIEDNSDNVGRIVDNIKTISDKLTEEKSGVLGYLINSEDGAKKLESVANSMASAAQRVDRILEGIEEGKGVAGGLIRDDTSLQRDIEGAADGISSSSQSLSEILTRANAGKSGVGVLVTDNQHGGVADDVRGIVQDVSVITSEVSAGRGTLGMLVKDDRLYKGAAGTAENLKLITGKINSGKGLLGVLLEKEAGDNARDVIAHAASIFEAVDDPEAGTLGLLVHDGALRGRIARIAEEIERLVVEFRDSAEDLREQAPVNAFVGAVFAAF